MLCLDKSHMQFSISFGFFLVWDFAHLFFDVDGDYLHDSWIPSSICAANHKGMEMLEIDFR